MEKKPPRPMTPFDELTMPSELQTLKLLLPYTPVSGQQSVWILIKFMELQYTIQFFSHPENFLHTQAFRHFPATPAEMLEEISPYLSSEEAAMLDTFRNVMNIMEMMQMFQNTSDFYGDDSSGKSGEYSSDASAEHSSDNSGEYSENTASERRNSPLNFGGMNPMDLMLGMLSPEQQEMFQMYQSMFSDMDTDNSESDNSGTDISGKNVSGTDISNTDTSGISAPLSGSDGTEISVSPATISDNETPEIQETNNSLSDIQA